MVPDLSRPATRAGNGSAMSQEDVRQLMWEIRSINVCLEDFRHSRANALGITGPQLTILMALTDLDRDNGVPVNVVAKLMKVDPSFVTTQSKLLEKQGFLRRRPCTKDARVVHLSLKDKACKCLAGVAAQQEEVDQFAFGDLGAQEVARLAKRLNALRRRLEKACLKVALGI